MPARAELYSSIGVRLIIIKKLLLEDLDILEDWFHKREANI